MENYLTHHGIKGQKWGVRRFQNEDGTLTAAGKKRYDRFERKMDEKIQRSEKKDATIMAWRDKNRSKIEAKYDKKISKFERKVAKSKKTNDITKIDRTQAQKNARLKDYDKGSEYVRAGMKKYNDLLRNYKNVRLSEISNTVSSKYAKSEVDRIIKEYKKQQRVDRVHGRTYTKLIYAIQSARN